MSTDSQHDPRHTVSVQVQRYLPEEDTSPHLVNYEVPADDSFSVLDALHYIKEHLDSSLSYRWSCRMAICGSCGVMVNGIPKLGCQTFLRDYPEGITVSALDHFPLERDLISDMSTFLEHLSAVKPWLVRKDDSPEPQKQTPAQMARYQQFAACINCGLCYAACPQFGLNQEFLGPAALTLAHRFNLDSRDAGKAERMPAINRHEGAWSCTFVGFCSEVCPKQVDPAAAVNQNKVASATDMFFQLIARGG